LALGHFDSTSNRRRDLGVAAENRRRGVTSARAFTTRSDASRPLAPVAIAAQAYSAWSGPGRATGGSTAAVTAATAATAGPTGSRRSGPTRPATLKLAPNLEAQRTRVLSHDCPASPASCLHQPQLGSRPAGRPPQRQRVHPEPIPTQARASATGATSTGQQVGIGAEEPQERGGGDRVIYCPIAWLPPGYDPGAAWQLLPGSGHFVPWNILDRRRDLRVAARSREQRRDRRQGSGERLKRRGGSCSPERSHSGRAGEPFVD
jgi:hypothetical protein